MSEMRNIKMEPRGTLVFSDKPFVLICGGFTHLDYKLFNGKTVIQFDFFQTGYVTEVQIGFCSTFIASAKAEPKYKNVFDAIVDALLKHVEITDLNKNLVFFKNNVRFLSVDSHVKEELINSELPERANLQKYDFVSKIHFGFRPANGIWDETILLSCKPPCKISLLLALGNLKDIGKGYTVSADLFIYAYHIYPFVLPKDEEINKALGDKIGEKSIKRA